jgi:asparagine N-glycosylation enzyme membrane subunit Stt3
MNEEDEIKINLGKIFPNSQTKVFFILFFASLLFSILSALKINTGITAISQFLSAFPAILLWALTLALAISTACAYFKKFKWMFLPVILWLLFTAAVIRTSNIPGLKDVTTGDWTLAPDLDPFLYLRHAKEIDNGVLQNPDMMRYVPLGAKNYAYQSLMPWVIFYFYKISQIFGNNSLTYAAIITPVILFIISAIGFLLFVKALSSLKFPEEKSWMCAIIAAVFYIFSPAMLHRTVAGVPEIESLGMIWFWLAFLFITLAWKKQTGKKMIIYGILSGIFTGLMSWSWGGYRYIYMIFGLATLLFFLFQKDKKKNLMIYSSWIIPALLIISLQIGNIKSIITNISDTGFGIFVLFLLLVDYTLFNTKLKEKIKMGKINLPEPLISSLAGILLLIILLLVVDSSFLIGSIKDIFERLLYPFGRTRVGLTVAENAVPYFTEILQNFGYLLWMFILGILVIFYDAVKKFSFKNRLILNGFFVLFIFGFIFSKYSTASILNGENLISRGIYLGGLVIFTLALLYLILKTHLKKDERTLQDFKEIDFSHILLLSFAFLGIISMRGAIRLLFIISPILPLISSFFFVRMLNYWEENKQDGLKKLTAGIIIGVLIVVMIMTLASYSVGTIYSTKATVPGIYEQQWQQAMSWVRENTPIGSVFVHWWDYGYWVQSIGERPTVVDGGHFIGYWPHLVGRYVLTTPYPEAALSFMKTHDVSYLLLDSTDIGKYGAYSSIGSDGMGADRLSQIPVMIYNSSQSRETNNTVMRIYQGGAYVDEDIIYGVNENQIFLPSNSAIIAGVIIETSRNESAISQPQGVFVYNQKQIVIPLRYAYFGNQLVDFGGGLNATANIIPYINQDSGTVSIDKNGAVVYMSPKVSKGLFAQLYLLNDVFKEYPTLNLAHTELDPLVKNLNAQGANLGELVYFGGLRGSIKIWKVNYPSNIITKEEFLRTSGNFAEFDNLTFTQ